MERLYDMHTHTCCSHDSQADAEKCCYAAQERNLAGIAFTDHCDLKSCETQNGFYAIRRSVDIAAALKAQMGNTITVMTGIELGDALLNPEKAAEAMALCPYDVVLGSVHGVRGYDGLYYAQMDFSVFTPAMKTVYLQRYFDNVERTVNDFSFDVLCHLTCPLRYMEWTSSLSLFLPQLDRIMDIVISKGMSLEVNTAGVGSRFDEPFPEFSLLERYYARGGKRITLGSDAHRSHDIGNAFGKVATRLRDIGFREAQYYQNRHPIAYVL